MEADRMEEQEARRKRDLEKLKSFGEKNANAFLRDVVALRVAKEQKQGSALAKYIA